MLKVVPWEIFQPRMIFNFCCTVITEPILWFSLDHFVDEIGSFNWPSTRHFALLNLNLFAENVVSDLFTWFANVWSAAKHALICHDSNSKIIYRCGMVDSTHHFWCHISWGSGSILSIFRSPNSCDTEISDSQISFLVDDEVLWLDVSMNDVLLVADLQASD